MLLCSTAGENLLVRCITDIIQTLMTIDMLVQLQEKETKIIIKNVDRVSTPYSLPQLRKEARSDLVLESNRILLYHNKSSWRVPSAIRA